MIAGICIYVLGIGLMLRYRNADANTAQIVMTQVVVGIGGGMLNVPAQLGVQASSLHQEVGAATALFLTIVSLGGAVGSAVSGAIWTYNIQKKLNLYLPESAKGNVKSIFSSAVVAQTYAMGTPERVAIVRAYDETMKILLIIAVCVCIPMLPFGILMENHKLDQINQGVAGVVIGSSSKTTAAKASIREGRRRSVKWRSMEKIRFRNYRDNVLHSTFEVGVEVIGISIYSNDSDFSRVGINRAINRTTYIYLEVTFSEYKM